MIERDGIVANDFDDFGYKYFKNYIVDVGEVEQQLEWARNNGSVDIFDFGGYYPLDDAVFFANNIVQNSCPSDLSYLSDWYGNFASSYARIYAETRPNGILSSIFRNLDFETAVKIANKTDYTQHDVTGEDFSIKYNGKLIYARYDREALNYGRLQDIPNIKRVLMQALLNISVAIKDTLITCVNNGISERLDYIYSLKDEFNFSVTEQQLAEAMCLAKDKGFTFFGFGGVFVEPLNKAFDKSKDKENFSIVEATQEIINNKDKHIRKLK